MVVAVAYYGSRFCRLLYGLYKVYISLYRGYFGFFKVYIGLYDLFKVFYGLYWLI